MEETKRNHKKPLELSVSYCLRVLLPQQSIPSSNTLQLAMNVYTLPIQWLYLCQQLFNCFGVPIIGIEIE
jgi:hypothetical protein